MATGLLLALFALAAALVAHTSPAAPTYSGDWLARELAMDTAEKAQAAITAAAGAVGAHESKMTPEEVNKAEQTRQAYRALMVAGRKEEALKLIDNLISEDDGSSPVQIAYLRYDRVWALKLSNRLVEALVELQRVRQLLEELGEPTGKMVELAGRMEQELENSADLQKLQLHQGAGKGDIRKSYKSLMMMLHPDKISSKSHLDARAKVYIAALYDKVRAAYDTLVAS